MLSKFTFINHCLNFRGTSGNFGELRGTSGNFGELDAYFYFDDGFYHVQFCGDPGPEWVKDGLSELL